MAGQETDARIDNETMSNGLNGRYVDAACCVDDDWVAVDDGGQKGPLEWFYDAVIVMMTGWLLLLK